MSSTSRIEWTDATWNPVTGCHKVSPGCKNCYAETFSERFRGVSGNYFEGGFDLQLRPAKLEEPLKWRQPKIIFVNSMSDLFHDGIPDEYIREVFDVMRRASRHTFQVLTKRSERMAELCRSIEIPDNVWMGVSVETADYLYRVDHLRRVDAKRFLSCEPLLGLLTGLDLTGIGWVIGGGESGGHSRPMALDWIRELRDLCERAGTPFHFKQWGGVNKKKAGRVLDGRTHDDVPGRTVVRLPVIQSPAIPRAGIPTVPKLTFQPKDPKRVAAAHRAWVTMRAGRALPHPESSADVLAIPLDDLVASAIKHLFAGDLSQPTIERVPSLDRRRRTAGRYVAGAPGKILVVEGLTARQLLSTIAHELCHHWCDSHGFQRETAHGPRWQRKMIEIGLMPFGTPGMWTENEIANGMFARWAAEVQS